MSEIKILEMPLRHINVILNLLEFSTKNPSLSPDKVAHLKEIEDHIKRQIR